MRMNLPDDLRRFRRDAIEDAAGIGDVREPRDAALLLVATIMRHPWRFVALVAAVAIVGTIAERLVS